MDKALTKSQLAPFGLGNQMDLPVGVNVGRVFRVGKLPINLLIRGYYNVVKPQDGADWQLPTQMTLIF